MANNVKYVIDDGKNKFAAYDAESVDSLLNGKVNNNVFNETIEELEGEIEQKANTEYVNEEIARIEKIIEDLPEPMIFKGTLGTGGTIQELPTASASNEGFTYKVITAGTYAGQSARVGDVFISNGSEWVLVPAGDDFNDTWRAIKVNGTEVLNNAISSGAVNFNEGDQLTITFDAETKTLNFNVVNTYTKQEVDDIIYNVLPDGTASGAIANFNTSLQLPIKSMQIDVNAKQDLHGYGYPWTAGAGKNKAVFENENVVSTNNINIQFIDDNNLSLTVQGTYSRVMFAIPCKVGVQYTVSLKGYCTANYKQVQFRSQNQWGVSDYGSFTLNETEETRTHTFTTITDTIYVSFYLTSSGTEGNAEIKEFMIEEGSTATTFEPYENICPIEGRETVQFFKTGKNLLNKANYGFVNNGNIVFGGVAQGYANGTLILPAGTYTFSVSETCNGLYVSDDQKSISVAYNKTFITFTISETKPIRLMAYKSNVTQSDILSYNYQLETGNAATTFEQYNGNDFIVNLGGTYYGGKLTQDKNGHRQFVVNYICRAIKTFPWTYNDSELSYGYFATGNTTDKAYNTNFKCECFKSVDKPRSTLENGEIGVYNLTNASRRFVIRYDNVVSVSELNELVGDYFIIYELATPIIIDLPDGEPINTFNGINNFFADSGDTTVIFKQSVNDAINAALNAANNNRTLSMVNMSKGIESEETKEETKEENTEK